MVPYIHILHKSLQSKRDLQLVMAGGGGLLTYQGKWGCAALMGRFLQEILKHGFRFFEKKKNPKRNIHWF